MSTPTGPLPLWTPIDLRAGVYEAPDPTGRVWRLVADELPSRWYRLTERDNPGEPVPIDGSNGHLPLNHPLNAGWAQLDLTDNVRPTYDQNFARACSPDRVKAMCWSYRLMVWCPVSDVHGEFDDLPDWVACTDNQIILVPSPAACWGVPGLSEGVTTERILRAVEEDRHGQ
jgi:hypothetical protein